MCRKLCQVSPAWDRRQNEPKPRWSCATRQVRDTIPPLFGITSHEYDLCIGVELHHFRHKVRRRKVCSAYKPGCRLANQLEGCFGITGITSLVSLDPGAAIVYIAWLVGTDSKRGIKSYHRLVQVSECRRAEWDHQVVCLRP